MVGQNEKVNILMVDDMPAKLLSYDAILAELGENLIRANSAREALEQLLKKEIAVVLMDVSMPEVDGFELAALIHEHPRHREIAIIFVSGVHLSDLDRMKAYQHGAVDYVSVPIVPEILRAKVRVFVELYRKKKELEQVNLELERRVAERTEELQKRNAELQKLNEELVRSENSLRQSERNMQQALAAAEEASRLKDQFLATVSHELRTPLNSILGWSQILESSALEPGMAATAFSAISTSAKNQAQIINDLLDISRIVNAKMDLRPQSIPLSEVLSGALNTLAHAIAAKKIQVFSKFSDDTDALYLYVDPQRLQQVFWNVLSNAVKFSPFGGTIEVIAERTASEAVISFKDGGKGITAEFLPFVFERFRQEDSSTTRKFGGLGLGLSIARHLIELHGGTITAESPGEGKGAIFSIRLPATIFSEKSVARQEESSYLAAAARTPTSSFVNLLNARVLLVDDDSDTLDLLTETFKVFGAEVRTSRSALVALGILNAWQPDVLVSDLAMPNQDGYWLIHQIRKNETAVKEMPAIALTAFASPGYHAEALSAGFNIFLSKPIEPHEVLKTVSMLLEKRVTSLEGAPIESWDKNERLSGKKILVVEDDLIFTEMLRTALEAKGLLFRSASTASAAFAIVQEWQPDAIISDLGLPDEDGCAFMERIRALTAVGSMRVPALALSGYGAEEGKRALEAGFSAFKSKPVAPSELLFCLSELFAVSS